MTRSRSNADDDERMAPTPRPASTFHRARRRLYLLVPIVVLAALLWPLVQHEAAFHARGPVSPSHATIARDCARCHATPFRRLRVPDERAQALSMNAACLSCHRGTVGHDPATRTARHAGRSGAKALACMDCHVEHRGEGELAAVDDRRCVECHADLRAVAPDAQVAARVGAFTDGAPQPPHPEFRMLAEHQPDPGVLRFNHKRHLLAAGKGAVEGAPSRDAALRCDDCHRAGDVGAPFRFGAREHGRLAAGERSAATRPIPRAAYMAPIVFASHCAGCHPLTAGAGGGSLAGGEVPHATPRVIRAFVRGQLAARGVTTQLDDDLAAVERQLYQREGEGCRTCHELAPGASATEPPSVVPPDLPARFFTRGAFDHAKHTVVMGAHDERACLRCHAGATGSVRTRDLLLPDIAECRRCHAPVSARGTEASGGAPTTCSTCHRYHEPPGGEGDSGREQVPGAEEGYRASAAVIEDGRHETREGLRKATAFWPMSAIFELPTKVWGMPELRPGTEAFRRELFRRYGVHTADTPNDGLPLGIVKTERMYKGQDGMIVSCEICHSTSLFGRVVVGTPNPFADVGKLWADLDAVAGVGTSSLPFEITPKDNPMVTSADQLGLLGLVLRKPDLSASLLMAARVTADAVGDLRHDFEALAYVKTAPWFTYATKKWGAAAYYADGGQPRHGNFAAFTYLSSFRDLDGQDLLRALAAWKRGGPAYLETIEPAAYPFPVQRERAARGRVLYAERCARCHGSYGPSDTSPDGLRYPGLVVSLDEVGTDPLRARFPASFGKWDKEILNEVYTLTGGYVAQPLTGIWSRAPYLHNGSVPTLKQLLDPKRRIARYALIADPNDPADFDQDEVGWKVIVAPDGLGNGEPRRVYDPARAPGLSNQGHTYGEDLDEGGRRDLLEFLKTL